MGMFMPCVIDCFRAGAIGLYGGTIGVYLGVLSIFIWVCYKPCILEHCQPNVKHLPSVCQVGAQKRGLSTPVVPSKCQAVAQSCQVNAQFVLNFNSHNSFISNILHFYPMYISF